MGFATDESQPVGATPPIKRAVSIGVFDRLKEGYYRRKFGPEKAMLILRVEREIQALPRRSITPAWIEDLWTLPQDAWLEAVEHRRADASMIDRREIAVQAITIKNKLNYMLERSVGSIGEGDLESLKVNAERATFEVERMKVEMRDLEDHVRALKLSFVERFGKVPGSKPGSFDVPGQVRLDRESKRWAEWLARVPDERKEEAKALRRIYDEQQCLRTIAQAVTRERELRADGADPVEIQEAEARIRALRAQTERLALAYRKASATLFAEFGEVDLTECGRDED